MGATARHISIHGLNQREYLVLRALIDLLQDRTRDRWVLGEWSRPDAVINGNDQGMRINGAGRRLKAELCEHTDDHREFAIDRPIRSHSLWRLLDEMSAALEAGGESRSVSPEDIKSQESQESHESHENHESHKSHESHESPEHQQRAELQDIPGAPTQQRSVGSTSKRPSSQSQRNTRSVLARIRSKLNIAS